MGSHPLNLALRFILELVALASLGYWGWQQYDGVSQWLFCIGLPLIAAVVWGTFAVPDDPSRSGHAPIPTAGWLRLILELLVFASATLALWFSGQQPIAIGLAVVTVLHYMASYDRIQWLLANH